MISLQKFLFHQDVASTFAMSPSALYERQRALVRVGLLPKATSRGPKGGGAMATPEAVAMVLLSVLVTDNLSEVDERMAGWASLRAIEERIGLPSRLGKCHFTQARTLHKALAAMIGSGREDLEVEVNRKMMMADIIDISGKEERSRFGRAYEGSGVHLKATFWGLHNLGQLLEVHSSKD